MFDLQSSNAQLSAKVLELAKAKQLSIGTAESCTGGLIGKYFTDVPGSSQVFYGGIIAYSNTIKTGVLNVDRTLIFERGAVSSAVAKSMAVNTRQILQTDLAISVTGIAGPTGGSPQKPVGLVYIGFAKPDGDTIVKEFEFGPLGRVAIREKSANEALKILNFYLI